MFITHHLLSLLIWVPIIGGFAVLAAKSSDGKKEAARWSALAVSIVTLLLCIPLYLDFNSSSASMQFVEQYRWFSLFGTGDAVYYHLGVDGFSVLFIILTCFTNLVIILAAWNSISFRLRQHMAIFLITTGLTNGVFAAQDTMLFYFFWEALLIPTTLGIGIWGGKKKAYAALKYFLYTFAGSVFLLLALLYIQHEVALMPANELVNSGTFSIANFIHWATQVNDTGQLVNLTLTAQWLLFGAFFLAFAVKIPMWPFHSWLPDAHSEAPAGGSVVLAALMLKLGAYGFLRFVLPLIPAITATLDWFLVGISLIAIVYVGIVAIAQTDFKRLIAYSSISHMGLVTLALFSIFLLVKNNPNYSLGVADAHMAVQGAVFQMIAHAFSSGGMFIGCGFLYLRMQTRMIADFQGVARSMPIFATFFMLFALANIGLPGTSGFVGEFLIILAVFKYAPWVALLAGLTLILAPAYTLWMYRRIFFGKVVSHQVANLKDISGVEIVIFVLLAIPTVLFGFYPEPILQLSSAASTHIIQAAHAITIG
ncbi:complex I subunit 4 family protein [Fangia hongkongensis]|uniref:complex I subunit 4 family protein n=1 Tax=Fangia hongkongensis TaxID=270495 RepID=UPI00037E21E7|nr:NADH-quinone oxidoreductase subunit M [Fangia hongkongensis]MBK2125626.1 NADH-quinone oxidoreductase subunit M [Fangia hongkongensis]